MSKTAKIQLRFKLDHHPYIKGFPYTRTPYPLTTEEREAKGDFFKHYAKLGFTWSETDTAAYRKGAARTKKRCKRKEKHSENNAVMKRVLAEDE